MVKAWGDIPTGVFDNVVNLFSNDKAYAALKADGSVQVWGEAGKGGTDPGITSGVLSIARHKYGNAFAALKLDGSVQAWGTDARGGCNNAAGGTDTNCVIYCLSVFFCITYFG